MLETKKNKGMHEGVDGYVATGREDKKVAARNLKKHPATGRMVEKLSTPAGRAVYAERKWLSEAPYGWIKHVLGLPALQPAWTGEGAGRVGLGVPGGERQAPAPADGGVKGVDLAFRDREWGANRGVWSGVRPVLGSRRRLVENHLLGDWRNTP